MKRKLRLVAILVAFLGILAVSLKPLEAAPPAPPPTAAAYDRGAYVVLGAPPGANGLSFKYGWRNTSQMAAPVAGYWLGLYDITNSYYVWWSENPLPPPAVPGDVTIASADFAYADPFASLAPGEYYVNFFVRSDYGSSPYTNAAEISLPFSVK